MGIELKKNDKLTKIITAILVGVLLLIVLIPVSDNKETKEGIEYTEDVVEYDDYTVYSGYYEDRLTEILENSYGAGTMEVMVRISAYNSENTTYISYSDNHEVTVDGVLIVADVDSEQAVSDITFAVCALFDLPAHKVAVMIKN